MYTKLNSHVLQKIFTYIKLILKYKISGNTRYKTTVLLCLFLKKIILNLCNETAVQQKLKISFSNL